MTTYSESLQKLLNSDADYLKINGDYYWVIPDNLFTRREIDELRETSSSFKENNGSELIANFLPDDMRPKGIPKL
ncbi:MAG: hypothetical protein IKX88_16780 [Thermoguttaceae bacterium]|nr:hypothetical protein [Thermoguttaceae bacterium]MBR5760244.1 hypothetical protein [Thermoguttaceae bacterium]